MGSNKRTRYHTLELHSESMGGHSVSERMQPKYPKLLVYSLADFIGLHIAARLLVLLVQANAFVDYIG